MRVITGSAKGVSLKTPDGLTTRPTADRVKEALFSVIQFDVPTACVLDLFGGTGQLGIEALSRGAKHAVFVDHGKETFSILHKNIEKTGFGGQADCRLSEFEAYQQLFWTSAYVYGDANGDCLVDASDALMILKVAVGKEQLSRARFDANDLNMDDSVDAKDALYVLQYAVEKIYWFPVEMELYGILA